VAGHGFALHGEAERAAGDVGRLVVAEIDAPILDARRACLVAAQIERAVDGAAVGQRAGAFEIGTQCCDAGGRRINDLVARRWLREGAQRRRRAGDDNGAGGGDRRGAVRRGIERGERVIDDRRRGGGQIGADFVAGVAPGLAGEAAATSSPSAGRSARMVSTRGGSARASSSGPKVSAAMMSGAVISDSQKPQAPT
jgi:hypothetical protein